MQQLVLDAARSCASSARGSYRRTPPKHVVQEHPCLGLGGGVLRHARLRAPSQRACTPSSKAAELGRCSAIAQAYFVPTKRSLRGLCTSAIAPQLLVNCRTIYHVA